MLEPVDLSTQVKRIADFAPVDDHLSYDSEREAHEDMP
jgi:hypothetical protein